MASLLFWLVLIMLPNDWSCETMPDKFVSNMHLYDVLI